MDELEQTIESSPNYLVVLGVALLCLALFWALGFVLSRKLGPALQKRLDEDKHPVPVLLLRGFRNPLYVFLILTGLCAAAGILSRWDYSASPAYLAAFFRALPPFLDKTMRVATIVCISWGIYASSDIAGLLVGKARGRMDKRMDSSVTRFLSGLFRVMVVAFAVVILLSEFGYNINGLITGLGLGGLTVALAAKDSASNLFGGIVLVVDKPFEIGDWISCSNVEGTVEDINMRNTIIRNDSGSLTTMSNALLSAAPITNFSSAMNQRRADITLNLVLDTGHQQMKEYVAAVRKMLETDPEVVSDSVVARFSSISSSSLDVRIIYYTALPNFREHLRIRERINYAILDLAHQQGVQFAYPTQTVLVSAGEPKEGPSSSPPS